MNVSFRKSMIIAVLCALVACSASPTVSGPDGVVATLNFRAYYANDGDATCLKSTLVNTTATY